MRTHYIYLEDKIVDEIPAKVENKLENYLLKNTKRSMEIVKFQKWS